MKNRALSIRARLSFVFVFLLLLVIALGLESLSGLHYVNETSAQIRDRWLPSTRALGDLNNLTTDIPAAEADRMRAVDASQHVDIDRQISSLERGIVTASAAYRRIRHDALDDALFEQWQRRWSVYRQHAALHAPDSGDLYAAASDTLNTLTERNVASAREASERSDLAYSQARLRIGFTVLLAALLVGGALVYVTRSISAPLVDLASRMHRLAASETAIEVLGQRRQDEIGEMVRAVLVFRDNAIDLATSRQALDEQAAALRERLAEEQRLTLLQRNFVAMASHEFRTPLGIIDGHAQRLISMRARLTADELAERARRIRSTVRRMTQLIDNLLGSARLIDGRIELSYHPIEVNLTELVREGCLVQRELTPEALIVDELPGPPVIMQGDPSLLSQMFGNLLSNAVKYSSNRSQVKITTAAQGSRVVMTVEDRGIGIAEGDRPRVFERYFRGSNTTGIVGSGVGLSLVKAIVELHGGSIDLHSREGSGTRFTLQLPALSGPATSAVAPDARPRPAARHPSAHVAKRE